MLLCGLEFIVFLRDIKGVMNEVPMALISDMINSHNTSRGRVFVCGRGDCSDSESYSLLKGHIVSVVSIKHTISEGSS